MILRHTLPVLAATALFALAGVSGAHAQKSYPVVCNGGGNMMAEVSAGNTVRVRFDAGKEAASSSPPAEGECRWLDRAFRSGEPNILLVRGNGKHADYIIDSVRKGETFYAHIYNTGRGTMMVERVGP